MKTKTCTKCEKEKSLDEFNKHKNTKDGLRSWCKECKNENDKRYRKENKEKISEQNKQYYEENKEKISKQHKQYRKEKAKYDPFAEQIFFCEDIRRDPNNRELLQVRCTESSCRKWFNPTNKEIQSRVASLNDKMKGENRFYCSKECKQICSCFGRIKNRKGENPLFDYRRAVSTLTEINYEKHNKIINPSNLKRGKKYYHIDHIYSVSDGFDNNVPEEIIAHPSNLRMLYCTDNMSKNGRSDITIEKLYNLYNQNFKHVKV